MKYSAGLLSLVAASSAVAYGSKDFTIEDLIEQINKDPITFAENLHNSEFAAISPSFDANSAERKKSSKPYTGTNTLPLVFLHGMGDSCFNNGMESITKESGEYLGVYSVCIPTGDSRLEDTINGMLQYESIMLYMLIMCNYRFSSEHGRQCRCVCRESSS